MQQVDKYARQRKRQSVFVRLESYGQIQHIVTFTIEPLQSVTTHPTTLVLAVVKPCRIAHYDKNFTPYYNTLSPLEIIDVSYIEMLIGRVEDGKGSWALIEREGEYARLQLADDDEIEMEARTALTEHQLEAESLT